MISRKPATDDHTDLTSDDNVSVSLTSLVHFTSLVPPSITLGFLVISRKSIYLTFTKFGMGVYWVNSLHGIAFGEDSSIVN